MLRLFFLIAFVGVLTSSGAQELYADAQEAPVRSPVFIVNSASHFSNVTLPPGYRMKRVGSSLTVGGAVLFIAGIVTIANADDQYYYNQNTGYYDVDPKIYLGSLMLVGGVGMMVPGIIFWVRGAKKYNRYLENLQGSIQTTGTGLAIRLKF